MRGVEWGGFWRHCCGIWKGVEEKKERNVSEKKKFEEGKKNNSPKISSK